MEKEQILEKVTKLIEKTNHPAWLLKVSRQHKASLLLLTERDLKRLPGDCKFKEQYDSDDVNYVVILDDASGVVAHLLPLFAWAHWETVQSLLLDEFEKLLSEKEFSKLTSLVKRWNSIVLL